MKEELSKIEIKNQKFTKVKQSTSQIYGFVYFRLTDFTHSKFEFKAIRTNDFLIAFIELAISNFILIIHMSQGILEGLSITFPVGI